MQHAVGADLRVCLRIMAVCLSGRANTQVRPYAWLVVAFGAGFGFGGSCELDIAECHAGAMIGGLGRGVENGDGVAFGEVFSLFGL